VVVPEDEILQQILYPPRELPKPPSSRGSQQKIEHLVARLDCRNYLPVVAEERKCYVVGAAGPMIPQQQEEEERHHFAAAVAAAIH